MASRKKAKRKPATVRGLRWRRGTAYYELEHPRLEGGRIVKAMRVRRDREELAAAYASALNTLAERGDWGVFERWRKDLVDITDIAHAVREGDYTNIKRITVGGARLGDAADRFMQRARATLESEVSIIDYETRLRQLVNAFGEHYPLAELTTEQAERFLHEPKDNADGAPWSANTQATYRTAYKAMWTMMIEQEAEAAEKAGALPSVTKNPWRKAKIQKRRKTKHQTLTHEQWRTMITHEQVEGTQQAAYLAAGIMGLRRREIAHLRTDVDVILEGNPRLIVQDRKGEFPWRTKTENSVREVPIPTPLLPIFVHHRVTYAGERYFFRTWMADEPMSDGNSHLWVRPCFIAAGIPYGKTGMTLHSLRHTCATWQLSAGVPLTTVAKWLGDTEAVVVNTYAHAIKSDDARAFAAMGAALNGGEP